MTRQLLVALYRGHPQLDPPLPSDDYKELIVAGANTGTFPQNTFASWNPLRQKLEPVANDSISCNGCEATARLSNPGTQEWSARTRDMECKTARVAARERGRDRVQMDFRDRK